MNGCSEIQPLLSAYLDGALEDERRTAVGTHLETCAGCRGVLEDLRSIAGTARALGPIDPPEHLWIELAGQMRLPAVEVPTTVAPARSGSAWWQWAGLTAALLAITAVVYVLGRPPAGAPAVATTSSPAAAPGGTVAAVNEELDLAVHHYERAIAELEAIAQTGTGEIDPSVASAVRDSIGSIDRAIAESREAVSGDPESEPARLSLFEALRQKISVLQATVTLINEMRQGDSEGAARAADGLGRAS